MKAIKLFKIQRELDKSNIKISIIEKELLTIKSFRAMKPKLNHKKTTKVNIIRNIITNLFSLGQKSFIMFTCGFHLAFNKKDGSYFKQRFEKLYFINGKNKINFLDFTRLDYHDQIFRSAYRVPIKFLNNNSYIYILSTLGVISIMFIFFKIEFFYNNIIIFLAIFYISYTLILSLIKIFNYISISLFLFSNKNKITNFYLTEKYDKFFFVLGFLLFNFLNLLKEICVLFARFFLLDKMGLVDNIEFLVFLKNKIYNIFNLEKKTHSVKGFWINILAYIIYFLLYF